MKYPMLLVVLLGMTVPTFAAPKCYEKVSITGYYVVLLSDYNLTETETIPLGTYNASFVAEVKVKTGGITSDGKNLVFWAGEWSVRDEPLDASYFPSEVDFTTTESVTTVEDGKTWTFPRAFVKEVELEGSGKIAEGQYLGWPWDGNWHFRHQALDDSERPVELGVVATDPKFFNKADPIRVTIDPIPAGFKTNKFWARDKGPAITDNRIDVFSGWGFEDGLQRALNLTSDDNTVCFGS